jgi:hypothetical protein
VLEQAASLAKLLLPKACHVGRRLALPVPAHSRIGRVHWRPSLRRVDTWVCLTIQLTLPTPTHGQIHLACPSRGSHCHYALVPHKQMLALLLHRAITSLPLSLHRPHCSHAMHDYKWRPPHCISSAPVPLSTSGKPSLPCSPLFSATPLVPSHLIPPLSLCACPGASPAFGAAPRAEGPASSPPLSSGAVDRTGELLFSVVHPPHCVLVPWTMSGRCVEGHGCAPWTPSHGPSSCRPPSPTPRGAPLPRTACHVDLDTVCPRPTRQATPCQGMPFSMGLHACISWPSVSHRRAASSRAMARALSTPWAERAAPRGPCHYRPVRTVVGPRQAEHALCVWAVLRF